jgi:hypothetical protein
MRVATSFDARLYRAALYLYPPVFRRDFSAEILCDFDQARDEAAGGRGLWAFRAELLADLAVSLPRQWLSSGWPAILGGALGGPFIMASGVARLWQWQGPLVVLPAGHADADAIGLILLATVSLVVIASTIVFTLWLAPSPHRRRR